jgi:hypothetical protein
MLSVSNGSVVDIQLSEAQLHAGVMAQRSFPYHSVLIKLISSNDICPIGSISYSCYRRSAGDDAVG